MNKAELVLKVAKRANITRETAKVIVDAIFEEMKDSLSKGERIEIKGFGSFVVKNYQGYTGKDPKTGRMEDSPIFQNRKDSIRLKVIYPAIYTRFDNKGREYDQKSCRSMNVSQRGVRLQSNFPVDSGELLDITIALGGNLVAFKGRVVYVAPSESEGFEFGISIADINDQDRVILTRFIHYSIGAGNKWAA